MHNISQNQKFDFVKKKGASVLNINGHKTTDELRKIVFSLNNTLLLIALINDKPIRKQRRKGINMIKSEVYQVN